MSSLNYYLLFFLIRRLNDRDLNVRLNCLLVLNHLILNDMIKPKGHVADIALCTLDGSNQVASLAKKFFVEYAEKVQEIFFVVELLV